MDIKARFANAKCKNLILLISSCVFFAVQIVMATLYFTGIVDRFGETISVVGAINLILDVFNLSIAAIMEYLLRMVLGIVYIVSAIIVIKNLIASIAIFIKAAFENDPNQALSRENAWFTLADYLGSTLKASFGFMMLSIMISADFNFNSSGNAVIIMGLISYLAFNGVIFYLKGFNLECMLYRAGATLLMVGAFVLIASKLLTPSFEELLQAFTMLVGGYLGTVTARTIFLVISSITMPILRMVLQFGLASYIGNLWTSEYYCDSADGQDASSKFMGMSIAIITCNLIFTLVINGTQNVNLAKVYEVIESDIPMLIASIAMFVAYRFNTFTAFRNIAPKTVATAQPAPAVEEVAAAQPVPAPAPVVEQPAPSPVVEQPAPVVEQPAPAPVEEPAPAPTPIASALKDDVINELKQYKDLLDSGIITQEEFDAKKKQILGM